jgi:hypothetical protein
LPQLRVANLLERTAIVGTQVQRLARAGNGPFVVFEVTPRYGEHVAGFDLLVCLQIFTGKRQQLRLCIAEMRRLDQVFSNSEAIVDWACGPGCQLLLRQKSYDRRRPTVRGRFVTTFGVKFCVST